MTVLNNGAQITYFGHATFLIKSPDGVNILIDPWTEGNPLCPEELKNPENIDVIAVTHGHQDHIGDLLKIANSCAPLLRTVLCFNAAAVLCVGHNEFNAFIALRPSFVYWKAPFNALL